MAGNFEKPTAWKSCHQIVCPDDGGFVAADENLMSGLDVQIGPGLADEGHSGVMTMFMSLEE